MKTKGTILAVGLAVAGLVTAVVLFSDSSKVVESMPQGVERESASQTAPVVALAPPVTTLETPAPAAAVVQASTVATEVRSEVATPVIRGRVVEADGGLARPGIEVQLKSRSEVIASTVSDASGHFELPFSNASRLAVEVVEPEGWQAVRRRQRLSGSELPAKEIVFELRVVPGVFFHGRAIDETSGDPLPYLELSVGSAFESDVVQTDDEGVFTSKRHYEAGKVEFALFTAGGGRWMNSARMIDFDGTSRVHDVPMPIGPTYELEVAAPSGYELADFRAFLSERSESCPWSLSLDLRDGEVLHPASPRWVRFLQSIDSTAEGEMATLWICTKDGRWLGSCEVPPRSSLGGDTHHISLEPCGSLVVTLSAQAEQRHLGVVAELRWPSQPESWGARRSADEKGRYRFHLVPPGDYVLSVESSRTKPLERTVRVVAGEPTEVEVALQPLPHGGTIRGFVRSESGRFKPTGSVGLCLAGQHSDTFGAKVEWKEEGGKLVGHFVFEDVPAGEYELSARFLSQFPWRASPSTVSPPAADVELLCLDGAGGMYLEVEAYDARTGEPVSEIEVSFDAGSEDHFSYSTSGSHRIELGRFPHDVALEWEATCEGHVAVAGNLSSFQQVGTKVGEPLLRARVELQPGWGGRVLAYTETERIADAVVLCDDVEAGRTNQRGELDIVLPARPQRFEVRHPAFVMEYPTTGQLPDDAAVLLCYMKPRE